MRGLLLTKPREIELIEIPDPTPGDTEVLIRVDNVGLCGSDIHLYDGTYAGPKRYPMFFGHEWSGRVVAIGNHVSEFEEGDPVTGDCSMWCGKCPYCEVDKNLCQRIEKYGITVDGASRELIVQKSRYLYRADREIDISALSLAEPLAVGCHGAAKAEESLGSLRERRVLVMGAGTIGLSTLMVLKKIFLCDHVEVYDPIESRRELALQLGADPIGNINYVSGFRRESRTDTYRDFYSEQSYEVVFETTGVPEALNTAMDVTRPLGTIILIGFVPMAEINVKSVTLKGLKLLGSIGGTGEFPRVLESLKQDAEYFKKLITRRFVYTDFASAFETASDKSRTLKVQIYFEERKR
jgi:threonine dehydrogenase-like Zn-dependent dehydrogenase